MANNTMRTSLLIGMFCSISVAVWATPEKAAGYYEDALRRYEKGDMPAAAIQLKNAIQQDQKMLAAHLLLGKVLFNIGDLKSAEAAFEEAVKQGVNRSEVIIPLGRLYLALGRPEAVIEKMQPTGLPQALQVEVLTMRGNAYLELGKESAATQSWDQARSIDPRSASPLIAEVPLLLAKGRIPQAQEKAAKAVELAPSNAGAWNAKASVLHAMRDAQAALAAYEKTLSLAPAHVDARIARAALLIDLKRTDEARKDLDYLKTVAEGEPRAAYLRSVLAAQKGDAAEAAEAQKEVTRTVDALPPAWLMRREQFLMAGALAHYSLGNYQKAREYLEAIIARAPSNSAAKKLLASIYVNGKEYARAQPLLEAVLRVERDDPQVLFMLGTINMAQRRYATASEQFERAVGRTGEAEMNRSLGVSLLAAGNAEKGQAALEKAFAANTGDVQTGIELATLYMRAGKSDKAKQVAESMVKRDPKNLTILNFSGVIKGASGDKAGARAVYQKVLTIDPVFKPAALNLARLDQGEKKIDEARQILDRLLKKDANDYQVLFEYGQLEWRLEHHAEAIRYLTKAGEVQRSDPAPTLALIDLYLTKNQADKAVAIAKDLAGKFSGSVPVQLVLARAYIANGDLINGRTILGAATRLAEFDPQRQVAIARLQLAAGNPEGASYSVYKALQGNPDDLSAMALAVQVEARRGDFAKADAALKILQSKHPNATETLRMTAELAMAKKQFASAAMAYRKLISLQESSANALLLINALVANAELPKAVSFCDEWLKKHPDDARIQKALADMLYQTGRLADSKRAYQRLFVLAPNDAISLNNYATLLQQLNDPAAEEFATKALSLVPEHPAYADTLGWILINKGQTEKALRYLREARLREPGNPEIRYHLAFALSKSGRKEEARTELDAALAGGLSKNGADQALRLKAELK